MLTANRTCLQLGTNMEPVDGLLLLQVLTNIALESLENTNPELSLAWKVNNFGCSASITCYMRPFEPLGHLSWRR